MMDGVESTNVASTQSGSDVHPGILARHIDEDYNFDDE